MDFDSPLFRGSSVEFSNGLPEEEQLNTLNAMPSVKKVWVNREVPRPDDEVVWTGPPSSEPLRSRKGFKRADANYTYPPHVMTQIDKLHAKGITGKGVQIAIIDTGVCANLC